MIAALLLLITSALPVWFALLCWAQFEQADNLFRREPLLWLLKGLAVPSGLWLLLNTPLLPGLGPLMPEFVFSGGVVLTPLQSAGVMLSRCLLVVGSYWSVVTLVWLLTRAIQEGREYDSGIASLLAWALLTLPVGGLVIYLTGVWGAGFAAVTVLAPLCNEFLLQAPPPKPSPIYARAVAHLKFGKYSEAEWEIIQQLEHFEDDFEGWMMLAELYAVKFRDLRAAEQTVSELCEQPATTPSQMAVALHKLADWELGVGEDPEAAKLALEQICRRVPGSHLDRMARLRINQLPVSREQLRAERDHHKTFHLPALGDALADDRAPALSEAEAGRAANDLSARLERDPDNVEAREELARLLAAPLGQPAVAIEQLDLLLAWADAPPDRVAHWLGLKAAWQLKHLHDEPAARATMEAILRRFPSSVEALQAQRRLSLLRRGEIREQSAAAPASPAPLKLRVG